MLLEIFQNSFIYKRNINYDISFNFSNYLNHLKNYLYKIFSIHKIEMQYLIGELELKSYLNINLNAKVFDFL